MCACVFGEDFFDQMNKVMTRPGASNCGHVKKGQVWYVISTASKIRQGIKRRKFLRSKRPRGSENNLWCSPQNHALTSLLFFVLTEMAIKCLGHVCSPRSTELSAHLQSVHTTNKRTNTPLARNPRGSPKTPKQNRRYKTRMPLALCRALSCIHMFEVQHSVSMTL